MIITRLSAERGRTKMDWLDSRHSFSFGDYYDPRHRGFRDLVVINEDWIAPESGFGKHGHRDMEILTYIVEGELRHEDSLGTGASITRGEVQRMSAGTGIIHSEMNVTSSPVHLLQIWMLPVRENIPPGYEQRAFQVAEPRNQLHPIASVDGRQGSLLIHQDAVVYAAMLDGQMEIVHSMNPDRHAWIQVISGSFMVNGKSLMQGDGAAISNESRLVLHGVQPAEFLLFELR